MALKIIPDVVGGQTIRALSESDTARVAAEHMRDHDVSAIVVVDGDGRLIGILTERDITRRVVAAGLDPGETLLAVVMTRDPESVGPSDHAHDALRRMLGANIRHLPIVDEARVVGVVSMRNLQQAIAGSTATLVV